MVGDPLHHHRETGRLQGTKSRVEGKGSDVHVANATATAVEPVAATSRRHHRGCGSTDAGIAAAVVAGESLVFAGNGFRCPLTEVAERYGAEKGSVTDIYLPKWFAHNLPAIHTPLLVLMAYLHARNLRRQRHAGELPM